MKKEIVLKLQKDFEQAAYEEEGIEYWSARDLQEAVNRPNVLCAHERIS